MLYVPGLITLIGLSITLPSFYKRNIPAKKYCLTLYFPNDDNDKNAAYYSFSKYNLERDIRKKNKIKFSLGNDKDENKRKMEIIKYEARKLKYTEDTSAVILIQLSDSINYGEFISIVDLCETDGHKRYASWDNKFVIFGEPPPKKKDTSNSLGSWACGLVIVPKPVIKPNFYELLKTKINKYYTPEGMYLLLGWIAVLLTFLYFRKRKSILQKH